MGPLSVRRIDFLKIPPGKPTEARATPPRPPHLPVVRVTVEISEKKTFPAILQRSRRHGNTHPKKRKRRNPRRGKGGASKSPAKARAAARRIRTKGCRPRKKLEPARMLSTCRPFPWSRPVWEGQKCVFNLVPCDNDFEREFAKFLDNATDVRAFSKLPRAFGFAIEYTDTATNLKHYEPDFVAIDKAGTHGCWRPRDRRQSTFCGRMRLRCAGAKTPQAVRHRMEIHQGPSEGVSNPTTEPLGRPRRTASFHTMVGLRLSGLLNSGVRMRVREAEAWPAH